MIFKTNKHTKFCYLEPIDKHFIKENITIIPKNTTRNITEFVIHNDGKMFDDQIMTSNMYKIKIYNNEDKNRNINITLSAPRLTQSISCNVCMS